LDAEDVGLLQEAIFYEINIIDLRSICIVEQLLRILYAFCDDTEFLDCAGGFDLKRLTALHMGWIWISASMFGLIPRFLVIRVS
jgi:hypothetical protein